MHKEEGPESWQEDGNSKEEGNPSIHQQASAELAERTARPNSSHHTPNNVTHLFYNLSQQNVFMCNKNIFFVVIFIMKVSFSTCIVQN